MSYVIKSNKGYLVRASIVSSRVSGCVYSATFDNNIYSAIRIDNKRQVKRLCKMLNRNKKDKCWVMSVGELDDYLWVRD